MRDIGHGALGKSVYQKTVKASAFGNSDSLVAKIGKVSMENCSFYRNFTRRRDPPLGWRGEIPGVIMGRKVRRKLKLPN